MKTTSVALALILLIGIVASACVNNCNGKGNCIQGECVCSTGWGGSDCSIWDREITSGQTLTGRLSTFEWHYYHISLPNATSSLIINATQTSTFGDIDMYVGKDYYPDTSHYIYKDQTTAREIIAEISPAASGVWYIGLYGYWSSDYTINVRAMVSCPVDCGPNGYCSGSQCVCNSPYTGEDCSIYDLAIQSGVTYSDYVQTGKWMYYHLDVEQGHYLNIVLSQMGSDYDLDLYVRRNERPTPRAFDYINATLAAETNLKLQNLDEGLYEIGVYGYVGGQYTLRVTTGAPSTCPNSCSAHGTCSQSGSCSCNADYSTESCGTYDKNLELGKSYNGLVQQGQWNYWHIRYFTQGSLNVKITQTSEGDCDTYIRQDQPPTRVFYQMADLSINNEYSLKIQAPGNNTWHIGVFGWTTCSYNVQVTLIDDCQCVPESHGSCSREGSSQCVCEMGWAGSDCTQESIQLLSGLIWTEQVAPLDEWKYYYFTSNSMAVSITMVETYTEGDLWLFVSLSGYPYGENFDYYDVTDSSFHEVQIAWPEPPSDQEPRVYFIGVVSSTISVSHTPVEFSIAVYGTPF